MKTPTEKSTGNDEWYTPDWVLDIARSVLGGEFDLDPASNEAANERVRATRFYDRDSDGLNKVWAAERLWLNPPYSRGLYPSFIDAAITSVRSSLTKRAAILTNNGTESSSGQALLHNADAVLFLNKRIRFIGPDGKPGDSPRYAQMMSFFGKDLNYLNISKHGTLMVRRREA